MRRAIFSPARALEHPTELRPLENSAPSASILSNALVKFTRSAQPTDGEQHAIFMANALSRKATMKRLIFAALLCPALLLTACKQDASGPSAAEAEALDYVRLVKIALSNAYYESGKPIPVTSCTDPLFGMKKTTKFLTLKSCKARMDSETTPLVLAVFDDDLTILGDAQGTRRVQISEASNGQSTPQRGKP